MSQRLTGIILKSYRARYWKASRLKKKEILTHLCETFGYHRKSATRLLNNVEKDRYGLSKPGRPQVYVTQEVTQPLKEIWLATDQMCSKKLKACLPLWLPHYEKQRGELTVRTKQQLLEI